ncbi:hypothetical protein [Streptomyces sp. NPDC002889]|uniref:hypothetical protein n=1 Tax=Streptomyces sp. NPDC002889 TaxID=3364669 RepID=UPI0036913422
MSTPVTPTVPASSPTAYNAPASRGLRGLTWAVLRLHRGALLVAAGSVAAGAVALAWLRTVGPAAARASGPCGSSDTDLPPCEDFAGSAISAYAGNMSLAATLIAWLPFAVAVYAGGVLIGRELERGTAALAWTQSVTPARWLAAKLLLPALLITAGTALLSLLYRWARNGGPSALADEWYYDDVFRALGPVSIAYALCGLAIGALAGLLLRRALPAAGLALLTTGFLTVLGGRHREQLWPATDRTTTGSAADLTNGTWQLANGVLSTSGQRIAATPCWDEYEQALAQCQSREGITGSYAVFHPASHFWPLQLVETGIVLALTAVLTVAAFAVLRRRHA